MTLLHTQSTDMSREYCATVVQIGEVKPIENSDFLATVMVEGREIVVRKDKVKEGDIMIYVSNECQLDYNFLHYNCEFEDITLNANYSEVIEHVEEMKKQQATPNEIKEYIAKNRGYFDNKCRVRMKRLRGVQSMGYLITPDQMTTYNSELSHYPWEQFIGDDFDTICGNLFVKAYVPEHKENNHVGTGKGRYEKRIKKYNRMIAGQFAFHYDTTPLNKCISRFTPDMHVTISLKEHGTSAIFGNVKVRNPRWGGLYARWFNYLPKFAQFTTEQYDVIYSSRSVIKNSTYNPGVTDGFYNVDVWNSYYQILKDVIPQGMTLYGEIVGYVTDSTKGIQSMDGKVFDYGCKPGENQLMIYRVHRVEENGQVFEYNVCDVHDYTEFKLIPALQKLDEKNGTDYATHIKPITILYEGTLKDLYPDLDVENHWHENLLERMKHDQRFAMEQNEPMCKNELPREGIVLRIDNDPLNEAFKLKCLKFLGKEAEEMDKGNTDDIEMQERYADDSSEEN